VLERKAVISGTLAARVENATLADSKERGPMTQAEMMEMLLATQEQQQETIEALQQRLESLEDEIKRLRG
jgi:hypothetical protein